MWMIHGQVKLIYFLLHMVVALIAKKEVLGVGVREEVLVQWHLQLHGLKD